MTSSSDRAPVLIVGIGNPMRRDDGVGPAMIERLRIDSDLPSTVELLALDGEPTRLIGAWEGRRRVVVIDATRNGGEPGTIYRIDPLTVGLQLGRPNRSSHGAGLGVAIELAGALGRLPEELVVIGVEPAELCAGPDLSPTVERALPDLVDHVKEETIR